MVFHSVALYFAAVSALSAAAAVADKASAKLRGPRVPESFLLTLATLGGSAAMFATMLLICHKTRHPKFMVGIPLMMAFQAAALFFAVRFLPSS